MAIVKYKNRSGQTYAYESISVWDPEKKQARPKRKYLGRVDPETGEIVPTAGRRGRPRKSDALPDGEKPTPEDYRDLYHQCSASLEETRDILKRTENENTELRNRNRQLEEFLRSIHQQTEKLLAGN